MGVFVQRSGDCMAICEKNASDLLSGGEVREGLSYKSDGHGVNL